VLAVWVALFLAAAAIAAAAAAGLGQTQPPTQPQPEPLPNNQHPNAPTQLRVDDEGQLALVGGHEFNATWLGELRAPLDTTTTSSSGGDVGAEADQSTVKAAAAAAAAADCSQGADEPGAGSSQQTCSSSSGSGGAAAGGAVPAPPLVVPRVVVELGGRELGLLLSRPEPAIDRLVEVGVGPQEGGGYSPRGGKRAAGIVCAAASSSLHAAASAAHPIICTQGPQPKPKPKPQPQARQEVDKRGYDGLVLECWQQWAAMGVFSDAGAAAAALGFMRQLGGNLVDGGKALLLAVPPALPAAPGRPHAEVEALASLSDVVAGFSVMT